MSMSKKAYNPWSIVAILCAVGLCPLFNIAAIFAGMRALVEIKSRQDTRGARLAKVAIIIGSLEIGLWIGGMLWWNATVRSNIYQGPVQAIINGQAGDVQAFQEIFLDGDSATASQFLQSLTNEYGIIASGMLNPDPEEPEVNTNVLVFGFVPAEATMSYVLVTHDGQSIPLKAKYELFHQEANGSKRFTNKFVWIRIVKPGRINLVYPVERKIP